MEAEKESVPILAGSKAKGAANPNPGRWTILFEDSELGSLESVSDERPLADIRLVERLIYA